MNGSDTRTGPGGKEGFRDHRHVDDDSVSLAHTSLPEEEGHFACFLISLSEIPLFGFVNHVGDPNQSSFVGMGRQVAVKYVVGDVDFAIGKPSGEGWLFGFEDGFGELEPLDLLCLLLPELLAQIRRSGSSISCFVSVLCHQYKCNKAVKLALLKRCAQLQLKLTHANPIYTSPTTSSIIFHAGVVQRTILAH
jgi:hypothetical protein